jgi:hypothetical protein
MLPALCLFGIWIHFMSLVNGAVKICPQCDYRTIPLPLQQAYDTMATHTGLYYTLPGGNQVHRQDQLTWDDCHQYILV